MAKIKTKDGRLEVELFEEGYIEIESPDHKRVAISISRLDPTEIHPERAKGALYKIQTYIPEDRSLPSEYGIAFIMPDGEIFSRAGSYLDKRQNRRSE